MFDAWINQSLFMLREYSRLLLYNKYRKRDIYALLYLLFSQNLQRDQKQIRNYYTTNIPHQEDIMPAGRGTIWRQFLSGCARCLCVLDLLQSFMSLGRVLSGGGKCIFHEYAFFLRGDTFVGWREVFVSLRLAAVFFFSWPFLLGGARCLPWISYSLPPGPFCRVV